MDEKSLEICDEKKPGRVGDLVRKYRGASKLLLPRAIFMMMVFGAILIFSSSLFMGVGISFFAAFASSGNFLATIFVFALELIFVFCVFVLHYGLFLSDLRFVRNQPVAISFLFAGFRQRRAKKFAAFFIVPLALSFALAILPLTTSAAFEEASKITQPQELLEYLTTHPKIMEMMVFHSMIFFLLALYFPFAFVWPLVYDETKNSFSKIFSQSLKFWKGKFWKFLGFEIVSHYKAFIVIFAGNALEGFLLGKFASNVAAQIVASVCGFVSFCATIFFLAGVILSINFFYNEFASSEKENTSENESKNASDSIEKKQNENSHDESPN